MKNIEIGSHHYKKVFILTDGRFPSCLIKRKLARGGRLGIDLIEFEGN